MTTRPRLRTTHRLLDRGDGDLQLGTGDDALVLTGLPAELVPLLRRLDGATTLAALEAAASATGVPTPDLHRLLDTLAAAGALDREGPSPHGHGRALPIDQVDALAALGVDDATARARLRRPALATVTVVGRGVAADEIARELRLVVDRVDAVGPAHVAPAGDVVVVVGQDALDPVVAGRVVLSGRPVLPVVVSARGAVIGPWHADPGDPCPVCLDLRRRDGDAAWPRLLDQVLAREGDSLPTSADPVGVRLAATVVTQWVRRRLVGLPETRGLTCEVEPWQLGTAHRVWPVHPRCDRHTAGVALAG